NGARKRSSSRIASTLPSSAGSSRSSAGNTASHKLSPTARSRSIPHPRKSLTSSNARTAIGWTGLRRGCRLFQGEVGLARGRPLVRVEVALAGPRREQHKDARAVLAAYRVALVWREREE